MLSREQIYEQLNEQVPWLKRRDCTPRVMADADLLLDQLIEIQKLEDMELDKEIGGQDGEL